MIQISDIISRAKALGACDLASFLVSSWSELAQLYFSAQGLEFCSLKNFPSLRLWRRIRNQNNIAKFGIFVEDQKNHCINLPNVAIIGMDAQLEYNRIGRYTIVLQHGASAIIRASNYAVLNIVKIGECIVKLETDNTVKVL